MTTSRPTRSAPKFNGNIVHKTRAPAGPRSLNRAAMVPSIRAQVTVLAAASTTPPNAARARPGVPPSAFLKARNRPTAHTSPGVPEPWPPVWYPSSA